MLPEGEESPWRKRETRRLKGSSRYYRALEDAAFPGISLQNKHFSVKKSEHITRAGPPIRIAGLGKKYATLAPARQTRLDVDKRPVSGNGKAGQKEGCHDSRMGAGGQSRQEDECLESRSVLPASSTVPTTDASDPSRAAELKRKRASVVLANLPPSTSSGQSDGPEIKDAARRALVANASEVRESSQLVKSYNSPIVKAEAEQGPSDVEELGESLAELGIRADLPP
jgi:hypothetical protein